MNQHLTLQTSSAATCKDSLIHLVEDSGDLRSLCGFLIERDQSTQMWLKIEKRNNGWWWIEMVLVWC